MITNKENKDSDELLQKKPCPISVLATFPMNGSLYWYFLLKRAVFCCSGLQSPSFCLGCSIQDAFCRSKVKCSECSSGGNDAAVFQLLQVLPIFYCTELSEPGFSLGAIKCPGNTPWSAHLRSNEYFSSEATEERPYMKNHIHNFSKGYFT